MELTKRKRIALVICSPTFILSVFIGFPYLAMELSELFQWPKWSNTISRGIGFTFMFLSTGMYVYCKVLFRRIGKGTTAPFAPPTQFVYSGPYKYSRNPIYIAYMAYFMGLYLSFGHNTLLVYMALVIASILWFIHRWEEPDLKKRFGESYVTYCATTPRWIGRRKTIDRSKTYGIVDP